MDSSGDGSPRRAEAETAVHVRTQTPEPTPAPVSTGVRSSEAYVLDPARRLVYRFLSLPYHAQVSIANVLGIWRDEEKDLHSVEVFRRCFVRAKQQGLLEKLSGEVEKQFASRGDSGQSSHASTAGKR